MFDPAFALGAAVIWAVSPIYYRDFLRKFHFLNFNFLRVGIASAVLVVPTILIGKDFSTGIQYSLLGGGLTLAVGDTLFLLSIRETGASVAAPVGYVYVLFVQLIGVLLGQVIPYTNVIGAVMVFGGVFILSRGGGGRPRAKGIAFALAAALMWSTGQELIQFATASGGNVLVITFTRSAAAAVALGVALLVTGKFRVWPTGFTLRESLFIFLIIVSDLVVGSLFFVYSVSVAGVALTVILTSLSPLLTQVISERLGKESPSRSDFAGGALIVGALLVAVAL